MLTTALKLQTKRTRHPAHKQRTTMTSHSFTTKEPCDASLECALAHLHLRRTMERRGVIYHGTFEQQQRVKSYQFS